MSSSECPALISSAPRRRFDGGKGENVWMKGDPECEVLNIGRRCLIQVLLILFARCCLVRSDK
jgi:hypothetical protein